MAKQKQSGSKLRKVRDYLSEDRKLAIVYTIEVRTSILIMKFDFQCQQLASFFRHLLRYFIIFPKFLNKCIKIEL